MRQFNLWSFQLYDGPRWITPIPIKAGTVSVTRGNAAVIPDATAAAAITAGVTSYSSIPNRQFRVKLSSIYNIISWDGTTLTLDTPYGEATAPTQSYLIFQNYYAAPYQDHLSFLSVKNMERFMDLFLDKKRTDIDMADPQRSYSYWPTDCVFYQVDPRPTSTTYKYPLYELWGVPLDQYTYNLYGIRNGPDLVGANDELPIQVGEDCVIERAKYYAYQWAEARKDSTVRGGPDFKFLMMESNKEFLRLARDYRKRDRERVDNWCFVRKINLYGTTLPYYNTTAGRSHPGNVYWR